MNVRSLNHSLSYGMLLSILMLGGAARAATPTDFLRDADRSRGASLKGVSWKIEIETTEDGDTSSREFEVKSKGNDAYVEATSPARNKGEIYLFNDRTMWFVKPGLRKPVSISSRQKLSGQAANGDIASTNYFRDYNATVIKNEKVGTEDTLVLDLKAKAKNVTYDQIQYWVSTRSHLGIKANFLTLQGEIFKTATFEYGNKINSGGKVVPFVSRMIIVDAKFPQNKSVIKYSDPREEAHPASLFNVNNIVR